MIQANSIVGNQKAKIVIDVLIIGAVIFVLWYVLKLVKGVGNVAGDITGIAGDITSGVGSAVHEITTNPTTTGATQAVVLATQASNEIKQKQTKTDAELQTMANAIFDAGRVDVKSGDKYASEKLVDFARIERELSKVQNDADFLKLIKLFGTQYRYTFGVPTSGKFDLINFVKDVYGKKMYPVKAKDGKYYTYIDVINANFKRKRPALKFLF